MGLPRTFVGFSSTDTHMYRAMCMWKANDNIKFDFCDCQLENVLHSEDENYIKRKCRERLKMAGTYIMLIGANTRYKYKYVKWEAEVALEQKCRIFGVNLDDWRIRNPATCPEVINDVGAMFLPFSANIIQYALENYVREESDNCSYKDEVYIKRGYKLNGNRAEWNPQPSTLLSAWLNSKKT